MITMKRVPMVQMKKDWKKLNDDNPSTTPFQEWELAYIIKTHYLFFELAKREYPVFFEFYKDEKPIMIAPLCRKIFCDVKWVSFGAAPTIAFQDFIYASDISESDAKECLRLLIDKCQEIKLENLPTESIIYKCLQNDYSKEYINITVPINGGYENWYNGLSKHVKQNIRTAYNRMNKDGKTYAVESIVGGGVLTAHF